MRRIVLSVILAALLAGCGQKGALYHPSDKPAPKPPAKPAATSPDSKAQTP